jgi:hypothetical protein
MPLAIPDYRSPFSATPVKEAYGYIKAISLDSEQLTGKLVLRIYYDQASADMAPIDELQVAAGEMTVPATPDQVVPDGDGTKVIPGTPAVYFPSLADFMADPEFAQAFAVVASKLEVALLATVPKLKDAEQLPLV